MSQVVTVGGIVHAGLIIGGIVVVIGAALYALSIFASGWNH